MCESVNPVLADSMRMLKSKQIPDLEAVLTCSADTLKPVSSICLSAWTAETLLSFVLFADETIQ